MKLGLNLFLIALFVAAQCGAARAQEIVAVLGSEQRPYREAYEGFSAAFGKPVPILAIGEAIPGETKIVLAFGAKAAVQSYPGRITLIHAIVPGWTIDRKTHDGRSIRVMMVPEAGALLGGLKAIQPGLKRLAVLWSSASQAASAQRLVEMGAARGLTVTAERLEDPGGLPVRLRELMGRVDAIWLSPDPLLINAGNFETIKRFSYDNNVPIYAPTMGLAEQGATAAVSVTYAEMGRTMAGAAKAVLSGAQAPAEAYSARAHVSVNRAAAAAVELTVPAEALRSADKVFP